MNKKFVLLQKDKLEKTKKNIEEELRSFATENPQISGDWSAKFPKPDSGTGSSALEDATDDVEEYITRLPIGLNLKNRLKDINLAIDKIKSGKYGSCEKCKKPVSQERLNIYPEAKLCSKCGNS